ncbi:hypothetical protein HYU45_00220 [Candidatus Daviesbacteria bacterium]|nr:hypothetical protein [Candidatus Daviesbacteria bacterium]
MENMDNGPVAIIKKIANPFRRNGERSKIPSTPDLSDHQPTLQEPGILGDFLKSEYPPKK